MCGWGWARLSKAFEGGLLQVAVCWFVGGMCTRVGGEGGGGGGGGLSRIGGKAGYAVRGCLCAMSGGSLGVLWVCTGAQAQHSWSGDSLG